MTTFERLNTAPEFAVLREQAASLTPPSMVLCAVMKAVVEQADWRTFDRIISADPVIVGHLLGMANSAANARRGPVTSIADAVRALGTQRAVACVIAYSVDALTQADVSGYGLEDDDLWRHTITMALTAQGLAKSTKLIEPSVAFTAGLLADVGKLVLGPLLPKQAPNSSTDFDAWEASVTGVDHATVSAWLLAEWGLPEQVVEAVRYHHAPLDTNSDLAGLIHAADYLSSVIGGDVGIDAAGHQCIAEAMPFGQENQPTMDLIMLDVSSWLSEARPLIERSA